MNKFNCKMFNRLHLLLCFLFFFILFYSCKSKYEKLMCGEYLLTGDSVAIAHYDGMRLELKSDKSFFLRYNNAINITGTWTAYDNGDLTIMDLFYRKTKYTCFVGGDKSEYIMLKTPNNLDTLFSENEFVFLRIADVAGRQCR